MILIHILLFLVMIVLSAVARNEKGNRSIRFFGNSSHLLSRQLSRRGIGISEEILSLSLVILLAGNLSGTIFTITELVAGEEGLTEIERREEDGSYEVVLEARKEDGRRENIALTVPEKKYKKKQIEEWFQQGRKQIDQLILGENKSLFHVDKPLNLIARLPDTPVELSWISSDNSALDWEGIPGEYLPEEGKAVVLYGTFYCQEQEESFQLELRVFSRQDSPGKMWVRKVRASFEQLNKNSQETIYLPGHVDGEKIHWSRGFSGFGGGILAMTAAVVGILLVGKNREKKELRRKREEQMLADYPEILNKFVLLLNAGMNTRKALAKIAVDYREQRKLHGKNAAPRAAYEEIVGVYQEMEQGVPEAEAYEHLGNRCDLAVYRSFATLLVQNLRKGNRELLTILDREAVEAFENRKRRARILGEKAGTKLLIPMVCMLLIVFVILLYPASQSLI